MATFSVPYQNLSFPVPDDGEVFYSSGAGGFGTGIYQRQGNTIVALNPITLGQQVYKQNPSNYSKPTSTNDYISIGLQEYARATGSSPSGKAYNMGDLRTAFGETRDVSSPTAITSYQPKVQGGETITKQLSVADPNSAVVSSDKQGTISDPRGAGANPNGSLSNLIGGGVNPNANFNYGAETQYTNPNANYNYGPDNQYVNPNANFNYGAEGGSTGGQAGTGGAVGVGGSSGGSSQTEELYNTLVTYFEELKRRGLAVNPNIEITPEKAAEFLKQAETEISPYYATRLSVARDNLLRDFGYTAQQISETERRLEQQYGRAVQQTGEAAAEQGFALSGKRQQQERDLAMETQQQIDDRRRQLEFDATNQVANFAGQFGTRNLPTLPTLSAAPRVLAGERTFDKPATQTGLYSLNPSIYDALKGTEEFQRDSDILSRASGLEDIYRTKAANENLRTLSL